MKQGLEFARKTSLAYTAVCKPLCKKLGLTETAFDILLFLANNPDLKTAKDIVDVRRIKANLVSVNVDRLAREGYLERRASSADRRKVELFCTDRAKPVIEEGRALQNAFFAELFRGVGEAERSAFFSVVFAMEKNLDALLTERKNEIPDEAGK